MPHGGNFNPEWGFLAPKPGFIRTVRTVVLAGGTGTLAGMAVAIALVARPAADVSVAARTMAQPSVSGPSPKDAVQKSASAFNAEVLQNSARDGALPQLSAHSGVDHGDLKILAPAESHSSATVQQPASVAALAEAPAVSNDAAEKASGTRPSSSPKKVSRVQQPAGVAALAEAPAWRDDASEMSSEAASIPSPKRTNKKAQVARARTPRNDPNFSERENSGPFDFLPLIGRTILGANPFFNDQVR